MIAKDATGRATERDGLFAGDDPITILRRWLGEAEASEPRDANAFCVASVDAQGLPNVRTVLLKGIEGEEERGNAGGGLLFYTNRESAKGVELAAHSAAAGVLYWKSLGRQIRFRGAVEAVEDAKSDAYFATRHPQSRAGAIASQQSRPLDARATLVKDTEAAANASGGDPKRPQNWGGYRIIPVEFEFWADGEFRLHDRFRWRREQPDASWTIERLWP